MMDEPTLATAVFGTAVAVLLGFGAWAAAYAILDAGRRWWAEFKRQTKGRQ